MGNKQSRQMAVTPHEWHVAQQQNNAKSHVLSKLCVDVCAEVYSFLGAKEHAACRRVCKFFCVVFDHAFQRGYVACAIHCEYVQNVNAFFGDGDPLHVAPVDQKNLCSPNPTPMSYKMQRSENDNNATLVVNIAKMLRKGETKLQDLFLCAAQFKAVHFIGTEKLEAIGHYCLTNAQNLACFTMSTPCPKLKSVGNSWLTLNSSLVVLDFSGCTALESVGEGWLKGCAVLEKVDLGVCVSLKNLGRNCMNQCPALQHVVLPRGFNYHPGASLFADLPWLLAVSAGVVLAGALLVRSLRVTCTINMNVRVSQK